MTAQVVSFNVFKVGRIQAQMRKQLIVTFKNPLLRLTPAQFTEAKHDLARQLVERPTDLELWVKWKLLLEVENG